MLQPRGTKVSISDTTRAGWSPRERLAPKEGVGIAAVAAHRYEVKLLWQARCKTDPIEDCHRSVKSGHDRTPETRPLRV